MVVKEARGVLYQLRMIFKKVLFGSSFVIRIVRSSILENQLLWIQLEGYGSKCIRKAVRNDGKGHLILLGGFMEHCD